VAHFGQSVNPDRVCEHARVFCVSGGVMERGKLTPRPCGCRLVEGYDGHGNLGQKLNPEECRHPLTFKKLTESVQIMRGLFSESPLIRETSLDLARKFLESIPIIAPKNLTK
jgi:hypothetical protein